MGHWISFVLTALLMVVILVMLFRSAMYGNRWNMAFMRRFGPFIVMCIATPLILADIVRHLIQDGGGWFICGNNNVYNRINSTDPYPSQCTWSSMQYKCTTPCCVSTWLPTDSNYTNYTWFPKQSTFYPAEDSAQPQFATLRPDGTLFYALPPDGPLSVYDGSKPLTFQVGGALSTPSFSANTVKGDKTDADCPSSEGYDGVNPDTGYCNLSAEKLEELGGSCDCGACAPETMSHLSAVGILFTLFFTYLGFVLLAIAVLWNANIVGKLAGVKRKWNQLRANAA